MVFDTNITPLAFMLNYSIVFALRAQMNRIDKMYHPYLHSKLSWTISKLILRTGDQSPAIEPFKSCYSRSTKNDKVLNF